MNIAWRVISINNTLAGETPVWVVTFQAVVPQTAVTQDGVRSGQLQILLSSPPTMTVGQLLTTPLPHEVHN